MGLLDHRRAWKFDVAAPPAACLEAFISAFNGKGGLLNKARWKVSANNSSASATYLGRKGLGAAVGVISATNAREADTAVGSEVSFVIDESSGGRTQCSMALTASGRSGIGGLLGATSDARFIRPYMQAVSDHIRKIDPGARIQTG